MRFEHIGITLSNAGHAKKCESELYRVSLANTNGYVGMSLEQQRTFRLRYKSLEGLIIPSKKHKNQLRGFLFDSSH